MHAIILAAGRGSRLGPDNPDGLPKCLLEFGGQSLIARHLDLLYRFGIRSMDLVLGYKAQRVIDHIATLDFLKDSTATDKLEELKAMDIACDAAIVFAERHADLAEARAIAVKSYLVNEAGLAPDRAVIAQGDLAAPENTFSGVELGL